MVALSRPSATSTFRGSQSSRDVRSLRFAGDWTYEQILCESFLDVADKSTASSRPCTQDAGSCLEPFTKDRVKVHTKVDKCFCRASSGFREGLQTRNLSITELGDLVSSRYLFHHSVARATTARNIINGRYHLLISGSYVAIPQRSCKISISGRKGFDIQLGVENRPQVNRTGLLGLHTSNQANKAASIICFGRILSSISKSENFKVKMSNVTQTTGWKHENMTSEWMSSSEYQGQKDVFQGNQPVDVDMLVPIIHELVEETTKLSLAMDDVNIPY